MRRTLMWLGLALASAAACGAESPATGLVFMDEAQYRGIPIADMPFSGGGLPQSYDLSADVPPPGQQGMQNSCVAWAVAYALRTYEAKKKNKWSLVAPNGEADPVHVFSPAYVYHQLNNGANVGIPMVNALNLVAQQGVSTLSQMPYTDADLSSPPPTTAIAEAKNYKILTWRRVNFTNVVEVKSLVAANFPVLIGAVVDQGFHDIMSGQIWSTPLGAPLGGHAMVVVGYDDARHAFKIVNSWGRNWGDGGFGWISYDHFPRVVREAYQIVDTGAAPDNPSPQPVNTPTPPKIAVESAQISILGVVHNQVVLPGVVGMLISGNINVPAGVTGSLRVLVRFHFQQSGIAVRSLDPRFATPLGEAATGTPPLPLNGTAVTNLSWVAAIPYCALNVPKGVACMPFIPPFAQPIATGLVADTTLFVNDFGVAQGPTVTFLVNM